MHAIALKCRNCGAEYEPAPLYVCRRCLGPLEVKYSYDELKLDKKDFVNRVKSIWRYKELLPIKEPLKFFYMDTGFTPLRRSIRLAEGLGLKKLYIKDDTVNPTGSFKDRPASIAVCKSIEFEFKAVGCASTGNLAAATASYAAKTGIPCYVFIPSDLEVGKILQIASYNPTVIAVKGTYDVVNRLTTQISELYNIAVVNVNLRPYYVEGSKTPAFEVCEQLEWTTPDYFIIPVGSGALLCAINRGLKELEVLDLIRNNVKLIGVQPEGCSPIVSAFKRGMDNVIPIEKPNTIVKSLAIGDPADGEYVLKALRESGGFAESVNDKEALDGMRLLAKTEGILTEPAGGVVIASLKKLVEEGSILPSETVVCYITGSGLKTLEVLDREIKPIVVEPNLDSVLRVLGGGEYGGS